MALIALVVIPDLGDQAQASDMRGWNTMFGISGPETIAILEEELGNWMTTGFDGRASVDRTDLAGRLLGHDSQNPDNPSYTDCSSLPVIILHEARKIYLPDGFFHDLGSYDGSVYYSVASPSSRGWIDWAEAKGIRVRYYDGKKELLASKPSKGDLIIVSSDPNFSPGSGGGTQIEGSWSNNHTVIYWGETGSGQDLAFHTHSQASCLGHVRGSHTQISNIVDSKGGSADNCHFAVIPLSGPSALVKVKIGCSEPLATGSIASSNGYDRSFSLHFTRYNDYGSDTGERVNFTTSLAGLATVELPVGQWRIGGQGSYNYFSKNLWEAYPEPLSVKAGDIIEVDYEMDVRYLSLAVSGGEGVEDRAAYGDARFRVYRGHGTYDDLRYVTDLQLDENGSGTLEHVLKGQTYTLVREDDPDFDPYLVRVDGRAITLPSPAVGGALTLELTSAAPDLTEGNGAYDLAGATFALHGDRDEEPYAEFTSDGEGVATVRGLSAGSYRLEQVSAGRGYRPMDGCTVAIGEYERVMTVEQAPVVASGAMVARWSDASLPEGRAAGGATLQGAVVEVTQMIDPTTGNEDEEAVAEQGATEGDITAEDEAAPEDGGVEGRHWLLSTDERGVASLGLRAEGSDEPLTLDGEAVLPLGTYRIQMSAPSRGYVLGLSEPVTVVISQGQDATNEGSEAQGEDDAVTEAEFAAPIFSGSVERADGRITVPTRDDGVPSLYLIRERTTGEAHVVVAEDGLIDTAATAHSHDTNGNDGAFDGNSVDLTKVGASRGLWFHGSADLTVAVLDDQGALVHGTYEIRELNPAVAGKPAQGTFSVDGEPTFESEAVVDPSQGDGDDQGGDGGQGGSGSQGGGSSTGDEGPGSGGSGSGDPGGSGNGGSGSSGDGSGGGGSTGSGSDDEEGSGGTDSPDDGSAGSGSGDGDHGSTSGDANGTPGGDPGQGTVPGNPTDDGGSGAIPGTADWDGGARGGDGTSDDQDAGAAPGEGEGDGDGSPSDDSAGSSRSSGRSTSSLPQTGMPPIPLITAIAAGGVAMILVFRLMRSRTRLGGTKGDVW